MTGKVVHFEIPYDDGDRAKAFYADVFGWQITSMPEFDYTGVATGPTGEDGMPSEPGFIGGGMFQRDTTLNRPVITIDVDDMTAALATVTAHGGAQVGEVITVGGMGLAGYFTDSEGNMMGLWQTLS